MSFKATDPMFQDAEKARAYLESVNWPDGPVCPHCGTVNEATAMKGKAHRKGAYQCNACRKQFSVTVGTVFERSKVPLNKWLLATFLLSSSKKGMSAHQLHRMLGVTYKTAWFMAHRIREAMKPGSNGPMGGPGKTVEADETYLGKRNRRRGKSTYITGHGWVSALPLDSQRKIVALVERGGKARSFHVDRVNRKTVEKLLFTNADRKSRLMTDEAGVYKRPGRHYAEHYICCVASSSLRSRTRMTNTNC